MAAWRLEGDVRAQIVDIVRILDFLWIVCTGPASPASQLREFCVDDIRILVPVIDADPHLQFG